MKILIFHADQYGTAIMVAAAAIASGVASQTIKNFDAYCQRLAQFVDRFRNAPGVSAGRK